MPGPSFLPLGNSFPAQDFISIAGLRSPGKATLFDFGDERGWDERQGYGLTGATLVPTGDHLKTFKIRFELWDPNQVPVWNAFANRFFAKSLLTAPGGAIGLALSIDHPQLKAPPFKVSACVVIGGSPVLENDGYGLWSATIHFKEFRLAKPALPKPPAAIPDVAIPTPTAQDSLDLSIQQGLAEIAALAGP